MQIRLYSHSDQAGVSALWERVFGYPEARNSPARVLSEKLRWDGRLFVALEREQVVGTLMVGYDGHRGWLARLAVEEGTRRRGIGRQLVRQAEQLLRELGCAKVNLQVHAHNEAAARFWEAVGYGREARIALGKDLTCSASGGAHDAGC